MGAEPSDQEIHSQVERTALHQVSTPDGKAADTCVICLNCIVEPCEALPCRHDHFDYICLVTWLQTRARCPLCNGVVHQVRYDFNGRDKDGKFYHVPPSLDNVDNVDHHNRQASLQSSLPSERRNDSYLGYLRRRRLVYRYNLYSSHVGSNSRQTTGSRYQELSPGLFATEPSLINRARDWLRRELRVFEFLAGNSTAPHHDALARRPTKAEYLVEYTIAILKTLDTQGSQGQAEEMIAVFLGRASTRLFLHELRAWLRSPYTTLSEWDRAVQYQGRGNETPVDFENIGAFVTGPDLTTPTEGSTTLLKYHEPAEARKPSPEARWHLFIFKGDAIVDTVLLSARSCWLLGRETAVVDMEAKHPSVSKQHAVIQFLYHQERNEGGEKVSEVKPYLIDLDSANGTMLNSKRVPVWQCLELRNKDMMTFGLSTREYVLKEERKMESLQNGLKAGSRKTDKSEPNARHGSDVP
ncbi:hypothetical protein F5B17DRAFT_406015 [Nemania serpens]|nr:hypothetical protein F5B17DRAFT_406015 [Nemania serpens]